MLIAVGKVERRGKPVCACCSLHLEHCGCTHDRSCFDTTCVNRRSTY